MEGLVVQGLVPRTTILRKLLLKRFVQLFTHDINFDELLILVEHLVGRVEVHPGPEICLYGRLDQSMHLLEAILDCLVGYEVHLARDVLVGKCGGDYFHIFDVLLHEQLRGGVELPGILSELVLGVDLQLCYHDRHILPVPVGVDLEKPFDDLCESIVGE